MEATYMNGKRIKVNDFKFKYGQETIFINVILELLNIRKITISMLFIVMIIVNYIMVLYL